MRRKPSKEPRECRSWAEKLPQTSAGILITSRSRVGPPRVAQRSALLIPTDVRRPAPLHLQPERPEPEEAVVAQATRPAEVAVGVGEALPRPDRGQVRRR